MDGPLGYFKMPHCYLFLGYTTVSQVRNQDPGEQVRNQDPDETMA